MDNETNAHCARRIGGSLPVILTIAFLAAAAAVVAPAETIDRVVAVVGGEVITLRELEDLHMQLPDMSREKVLELLIEDLLVEQEAQRQGIVVTEAEIDASVQSRIAQLGVSEDQFRKMLAEQGMTMEMFRDSLRRRLVKVMFVRQQMRGGIEISDEELLNYYRQHKEDYMQGEEVHIAHILLPFPLGANDEGKDIVRKLGEELYKRIQSGEDFAEIAKKYSKGGGNDSGGGDLGWIKKDEINMSFRNAIRGLKAGEVSEPFETDSGIHLIKVVEEKKSEAVPFEDVKNSIYNKLYDIKIQEELYKLIQGIKEKTPIERKL